MFRNHYESWTKSRMATIKKYLPEDFFVNKTLLELGAGHGHNGKKFNELGAIVTSCDARKEHIEKGKILYPDLLFQIMDSDKDLINKKYDIILHWGLLYHLKEIDKHLANVCQFCDILLLETEVADSDDETFFIENKESGYDQAFNSIGIRPSPSYIEKILKNNGFDYKMIKDSIVNSGFHIYDWDIKNTKKWKSGMRRFWICWKKDLKIDLKN